jgi:hypothetical protein
MVRKMLRLGLGTRAAGATLVTVLLLSGLAAAACGGAKANVGSGATVPRAVSTSTTSSDPYAIPSPITAAYVQRVLAALDAISADAIRIVIAQGRLVPDAARRLRAISTSTSFEQQSMIMLNQIGGGLANYRKTPGPVRDTVQELILARPSCIFASLTRDLSAVEKQPETLPTNFVVLRPRSSGDDPTNLNPTPWVIDFLGYDNTGAPIANSCVTQS